jgi:glycosyltransferase involved in cell wall biosynthesis
MTGVSRGRILYWGDAPTVCTGFGVVARHVLRALHDAGYSVDCLGINAASDFPDRSTFPYPITPAGVAVNDPCGYRMLVRNLLARRYDVLFAQNDSHVLHPAAGHLSEMRMRGAELPSIVCYYPVDCSVRSDMAGMLDLAEVAVTCTELGRRETEKAVPGRSALVVPHGVDTRAFRPLAPGDERGAARVRFRRAHNIPLGALLVCSVAVNNVRKDLPRTISAFARLREARPQPAVLYLHTRLMDGGFDLVQAAAACGLVVGRDIIFPDGYHHQQGISDVTLNEMYNAADLYLTTTLGEGWGLPITEAMAAGLPVVAPRHSSLAEIGGEGRAILYECREQIWVDNSGYRPLALMDDIVAALERALDMPDVERRRMIEAARAFACSLDWSAVAPRWVPIVDSLMARRHREPAAAGAP